MKHFVSMATAAALALTLMTPLFAACDSGEKPSVNFGNATDGTEVMGTWEYGSAIGHSVSAEDEAHTFTEDLYEDYKLTYFLKAPSYEAGQEAYVGGYAYYAEEDDSISYLFDVANHTLVIERTEGFDSYETTNAISSSLSFETGFWVQVERIGGTFKFLINGEIVQTRTYDVEDETQVGLIARYAAAEFAGFKIEAAEEFTSAPLARGVYEVADVKGSAGEWTEATATAIESPVVGGTAALLFSTVATDCVLEVELQELESAGSSAYAGIGLYVDNMDFVFAYAHGGEEGTYYCENQYEGWANSGITKDYTAGEPINIRLEKIGSEVRVAVNGALTKVFDSDKFEAANLCATVQQAKARFRILKYEEISAFTIADTFLPTNGTTGYPMIVEGSLEEGYTFQQNSGSAIWGDFDMPDPDDGHRILEGGIQMLKFNTMAKNYTFEAKVTVSQNENASGVAGVIAFYSHQGNGAYVALNREKAYLFSSMDSLVATVTLADYEIDPTQPITVKVVKSLGTLTITLNGQAVFEPYFNQHIAVAGLCGFLGSIPAKNSGKLGQFGAYFSDATYSRS